MLAQHRAKVLPRSSKRLGTPQLGLWRACMALSLCAMGLSSLFGEAFASGSSLHSHPGVGFQQNSLRLVRTRRAAGRSAASEKEWFSQKGEKVEFGARGKIYVPLAGRHEQASAWLLGAEEGDDSVDRLIKAARPAGANVEEARHIRSEDSAVRNYYLHLPPVDVPGLGTAKVSVIVWGAIRSSGGPQSDNGPYLEIGSARGPEAVLEMATGQKMTMPTFNLAISGALGIEPSRSTAVRSSEANGWVKVEIKSDVPAPFGLMPPEIVLREAARTVCRATLNFAADKLSRDLSVEFSKWSRERRRAEVIG
mmetsp:Transcript_45479/g.83233  ORF Transcript_45479/g.83233 Transcript_45479/m.83233 type:complete len:309 (-) Transcript_45479:36-962(-)